MFVCSFVHLFFFFFFEFYNLINGPFDNIVVRPSRVCGEREKTKEDRIDEKKKKKKKKMQAQQVPVLLLTKQYDAQTIGARSMDFLYIYIWYIWRWRNEDDFFHKTDKFSIHASEFCICYQHVQKLECLGKRVK